MRGMSRKRDTEVPPFWKTFDGYTKWVRGRNRGERIAHVMLRVCSLLLTTLPPLSTEPDRGVLDHFSFKGTT